MGLFGEQVSEEIEAKDKRIAELEAKLARKEAKAAEKLTSKVAASDVDDDDIGRLSMVSVKLPPFTESNPALWFGKAEAQFALRGIKDDTTKFYHLYANLTEKAMNEIENLLLDPPKTGKVETMKYKLIRKFGKSQYQKDSELLSIRSLGDLRPTEMWLKFQRLNKDPHNTTSSFVKAYLIDMYPPEVRTAIANMTFADNDEMAEAADKIMDMRKAPHVNAIAEDQGQVPYEIPEVDAIGRGQPTSRGRGSSRGRPNAGGQKPPGSKPKTCFYHDRHGLSAFRCDGSPCPFANAPLANRPSGNATAGR